MNRYLKKCHSRRSKDLLTHPLILIERLINERLRGESRQMKTALRSRHRYQIKISLRKYLAYPSDVTIVEPFSNRKITWSYTHSRKWKFTIENSLLPLKGLGE